MRTHILLFVMCMAVAAQTREQVEAQISKLPSDRQAYERYRFWATTQPRQIQNAANELAIYREYLKKNGFSDSEIEAQIRIVADQGKRLEVERWNQILTAEQPRFNTAPNTFLVDMVKVRRPGTALDVGMGQGRNAIWLAQQGWDVTGFDPADKAVALARQNAEKFAVKLRTEVKGFEDFDFGDSAWDLIVLSYVGGREIVQQVEKALKPGGIVVIEGFHRDATRGRSIGSAVVFNTGELPTLFGALRTVRYEEPVAMSDFGQVRTRVVRYCAERPKE